MLGRTHQQHTGIGREVHEELAKSTEEVGLMHSMGDDFRRLRERASEIRERNGFEELMTQLLGPPGGGTKPHGSSNGK